MTSAKKDAIPDTHHTYSHRCECCGRQRFGVRMYTAKLLHGDKFGVYCNAECYRDSKKSQAKKCVACGFTCNNIVYVDKLPLCKPCSDNDKKKAAAVKAVTSEVKYCGPYTHHDEDVESLGGGGDYFDDAEDDQVGYNDIDAIPDDWDGQWSSLA